MKTNINISNLKKMVVTFAATMVLTAGTFANPANSKEETIYVNRLEALMNETEQSVRFIAPAVEESQEVVLAMEELNEMADLTEASVKYVAPVVEESQEVASAFEGLDKLAADIEAAVAFKAPRADDSMEGETTGTPVTDQMLAETK